MGFELNAEPSPKEMANEFVDRMKSTLNEARAALRKSKDDMARYYNQHREPMPVSNLAKKSTSMARTSTPLGPHGNYHTGS